MRLMNARWSGETALTFVFLVGVVRSHIASEQLDLRLDGEGIAMRQSLVGRSHTSRARPGRDRRRLWVADRVLVMDSNDVVLLRVREGVGVGVGLMDPASLSVMRVEEE